MLLCVDQQNQYPPEVTRNKKLRSNLAVVDWQRAMKGVCVRMKVVYAIELITVPEPTPLYSARIPRRFPVC